MMMWARRGGRSAWSTLPVRSMMGPGAWRSRLAVAVALAAAGVAPAAAQAPASGAKPTLRVCADPNNLPFSNQREQGFENRIAELIAHDLGTTVEYQWRPQRRGFVRATMGEGKCDLMVGVATGYELVATTRPYYQSTYAFVYRSDRGYHITSFDDPILHRLTIGVHITGDDYENPPPARALAVRHIVDNVKGYMIYGDYSQPNPPADVIDAVANGDIDVAIVWGPFAGYFATREPVPLTVVPVSQHVDSLSGLPMAYPISMGVPRGDTAAVTLLDSLLQREQPAIDRILRAYGVPLVRGGEKTPAAPPVKDDR